MADDRWVVCPLCALNRKLIKSGMDSKKPIKEIKGAARFDKVDPRTAPFIDIRDISGGRATGFPRIDFKTLEEVKDDPEYRDLVNQIRTQCELILHVIGTW